MAFSQYSVRNTFIQLDENSDDDIEIGLRKRSLTWDGSLCWESQSDCCFEAETESTLGSDSALDDKSFDCASDVSTKDDASECSVTSEMSVGFQGKQAVGHDCYMPFQGPFGMVAMQPVQCVVAQPVYYVMQNLEDLSSIGNHLTPAVVNVVTESKDVEPKSAKKGLSGAQRRKIRKAAARQAQEAFEAASCELLQD